MSLSLSFLSLSLSSCLHHFSICSPLPCCTSPQLPVFCTFGLFSLHLSLLFPCLLLPPLPPFLLSAIPLSVAECSQIYVSGHIWAELSQHHTQDGRRFTDRQSAQRKTTVLHIRLPSSLACYSPTTFLASVHSCAVSFPSHNSLTLSP